MDAEYKADLLRDIEFAISSAEAALSYAEAENYKLACVALTDVRKLISGWERDLKQEIEQETV
jgi:hypothetical protein